MNNDLISRAELKKAIEELAITEELVDYDCDDVSTTGVSQYLDRPDVLNAVDNARVVVPEDFMNSYEEGYERARKDFERPHGEWVKSKDGYTRCDQCGSRGSAIKARFCHHCGAEMRGNKNEVL